MNFSILLTPPYGFWRIHYLFHIYPAGWLFRGLDFPSCAGSGCATLSLFAIGWVIERTLVRRMYGRELPEQLLLTFALI